MMICRLTKNHLYFIFNSHAILLRKKKKGKNQQTKAKKNIKPVEEIKVEQNEEQNFDTHCKFEFPVFATQQKEAQITGNKAANKRANNNNIVKNQPPPKTKKINSTNSWEKQNANPFLYYSTENKVSKKALNEEFPSLAGENKGSTKFYFNIYHQIKNIVLNLSSIKKFNHLKKN